MDNIEKLSELISKYLEVGDSHFYICTRDKTAFSIGTIRLDDFVEVDDEIASDMAEWLTKRGVVVSSNTEINEKVVKAIRKVADGVKESASHGWMKSIEKIAKEVETEFNARKID